MSRKGCGVRILTLRLKRHWWEQIANGEKSAEMRLRSEYWARRLEGREYDEVHIWLGYPPASDRSKLIRRRWAGFRRRTVRHEEFGSEPVPVYAIDVSQAGVYDARNE